MVSIICADDDEFMRDLYTDLLTAKGYSVRLFPNGDDALAAFYDEPSDLLVLDVDMPGKTGIESCKELRQSREGYAVPIMIVSGRDTEEDIVNGLTAGADDYIVKSFKPAEFLAKVAALLKKHEARTGKAGLGIGDYFVGRYRIIKQLGQGGAATVYLAADDSQDSHPKIALKVFEMPLAAKNDKRTMSIFLREAYGLSKLDYPSIVKLHSFGHDNLVYYLVMEYVGGKNLVEIVKMEGPLEESTVIMIARMLVDALKYLDSKGVVHRDITPNNIIIDPTGTVKLIDFGLAKDTSESSITTSGKIKGTPSFVAPEIISGTRDIDVKADIFAIGATLYYAASGTVPFNSKVLKKPQWTTPRRVNEVNPEIGEKLSELIDHMLVKESAKRATIGEIDKVLSGFNPPTDSLFSTMRKLLLPRFF